MRKKLVEEMRRNRKMSEAEATRSADEVFDALGRCLDRGERISIQGFGTFELKKRKGRLGRNPRTGESVEIPARDVKTFREARQRSR